jgi:hypothetical protein
MSPGAFGYPALQVALQAEVVRGSAHNLLRARHLDVEGRACGPLVMTGGPWGDGPEFLRMEWHDPSYTPLQAAGKGAGAQMGLIRSKTSPVSRSPDQ